MRVFYQSRLTLVKANLINDRAGQKTEIGDQRSEAGGQPRRSEDRRQMTEVSDQMTEDREQRSEVSESVFSCRAAT
jgi:hypothetical protein